MIGMSGTSKDGSKHFYYICNEKRTNGDCDKKAIRRDYLEYQIAKAVKEYILQDDVIEWIINQVLSFQKADTRQQEISNMQLRQKEIKRAITNILTAIDQGIFTTSTKDHLLELESENAQLSAKITTAQEEAGKAVSREALLAYLEHFKTVDIENKNSQKELFDAFVKKIYLYDNHINIVFDLQNETTKNIDIDMDNIEKSLNENVRLSSTVGHQT